MIDQLRALSGDGLLITSEPDGRTFAVTRTPLRAGSTSIKVERQPVTVAVGADDRLTLTIGPEPKAKRRSAPASAELAEQLRGFVEWAEEHRRNAKALGERPAIDAHRITRAKAALKRAGL